MQRYIVSYTNETVTVADLGAMRSSHDIMQGDLYATAPKVVYTREGKRGTRLRIHSGDDTTGARKAAHRLFYGPAGDTRAW